MSASVDAPRIEHHRRALGIGEARPRLSWRIAAAPAGWTQAGYRVTIDRDAGTRVIEVDGPDQVLVPWPDEPLVSRERATVSIQVRGSDGAWSEPSAATTV